MALEIARNGAVAESKKAMYPAQSVSKRLALGNLWFWYKNPDFCLVLGLLYLVCGLLILASNGYGSVGADARFLDRLVTQIWLVAPSPVFVIVAFSLFLVFFFSAEIRVEIPGWKKRASEKLHKWRLRETSSSKLRRYTAQAAERSLVLAAFLASRKLHVVTLHWIAHVLVLTVGVSSISVLAAYLTPSGIFADLVYFLILSLGLLLSGFIGGSIWGIYLTAASWFWGDESNAAFSAMRLDSYRHFIRFKIESDKITIYPIGIDEAPKRSDWKTNDDYVDANADQDTPAIVPIRDLGQRLIEEPVVIELSDVSRLRGD